ncbi:plasminogen receptor (KT) [Parasteatoda tepidariorum]|uniref:plasminogen receptor (KT) n=1 Tax=Parasteatoda tepidariorum TaxID=114398 RepID=UPI00077FC8EB|nr:plasminogen receptor (KT) [Parasteatoda tepidariorum]
MGSFFGKSVDENFKRNQDFMLQLQRLQLERQIHMRNQLRERKQALQIAKSRELFYWIGTFYVLAAGSTLFAFQRTKKPAILSTLLPLTFVFLYQGDLAYGSKLQRIHSEAENILQFEEHLLHLPFGPPNFESIEEGRQEQQDEESLTKAHDIFL